MYVYICVYIYMYIYIHIFEIYLFVSVCVRFAALDSVRSVAGCPECQVQKASAVRHSTSSTSNATRGLKGRDCLGSFYTIHLLYITILYFLKNFRGDSCGDFRILSFTRGSVPGV